MRIILLVLAFAAFAGFQAKAQTACTGLPSGGVVTGPGSICAGVTFTLSVTGASVDSGISYQWQVSTVSSFSGFSDISGADSTNYSTFQYQPSWYRVIVTCSNSLQSSNSTTFMVLSNGSSYCFCTST